MQESTGIQKMLMEFRENRLSHAFLLETNHQEQCFQNLLTFLCEINQTGEKNQDEKLTHLIMTQQLPSLVVIRPDGQNIKKEQILELKRSFQTKPTFSKYNMYIILDAQTLNSSSANTMLKFLEEPEDQILGFFLTNNKENIIDTIKSRCQIILDYYHVHSQVIPKEWVSIAVQYLKEYEIKGIQTVFYNKNVLLPLLHDRNELNYLFQSIFSIYQNFFLYQTIHKEIDKDYLELDFLIDKETDYFQRQITYIAGLLQEINYNVNINFLLDRFVLESRDEVYGKYLCSEF